MHGQAHRLRKVVGWLKDILIHKAYGSANFPDPEQFLFSMDRLKMNYNIQIRKIALADEARTPEVDHELSTLCEMRETLGALYIKRCQEQISQPGNAQALAMRIVCAINNKTDPAVLTEDVETLRSMQLEDGSWPWCVLYHAPTVKYSLGCTGVVTALAIKALKMVPGWWNEENAHSQQLSYLAKLW
jgi:hypothetical protein